MFEDEIAELYKLLKLPAANLTNPDFSEEDLLNQCIAQLKKIPYIPFPIALHTIDIIPFRIKEKNTSENILSFEVLLGRKKGEILFQTIGGFVDSGESAETSAIRELTEEGGLKALEKRLKYLGSFFIDDKRYRDSIHKISSSVYAVEIDAKAIAIAGDDIEEVKWYDFCELQENYKTVVVKNHWQLLEKFFKQF